MVNIWYISPSQSISVIFFNQLGFALGTHRHTYETLLLAVDLNAEETDPCMSEFLTNYDSQNLVKDKTCLKNPENPRCIDRYIINSSGSYQNTATVVNTLLDAHIMTLTVCKNYFHQSKPKEIVYMNHKKN